MIFAHSSFDLSQFNQINQLVEKIKRYYNLSPQQCFAILFFSQSQIFCSSERVHFVCIEQLKGKILEFITPEDFHLVEQIHQNLYKKSSDLTKKRHMQKFDKLISKDKVTKSATYIKCKTKQVINMSSGYLTHIKIYFFEKNLNFSTTSKTLFNKDTQLLQKMK